MNNKFTAVLPSSNILTLIHPASKLEIRDCFYDYGDTISWHRKNRHFSNGIFSSNELCDHNNSLQGVRHLERGLYNNVTAAVCLFKMGDCTVIRIRGIIKRDVVERCQDEMLFFFRTRKTYSAKYFLCLQGVTQCDSTKKPKKSGRTYIIQTDGENTRKYKNSIILRNGPICTINIIVFQTDQCPHLYVPRESEDFESSAHK